MPDSPTDTSRIISASRVVAAPAAVIFDILADPARHPDIDGNDNVAEGTAGSRVRALGEIFTVTLTTGSVRENHVVEFEEGRRIAWRPAEPGATPPGHLWRWEIEPIDDTSSRVVHTYDWTALTDEQRIPRARSTTTARLRPSIDRLALVVAE